MVDRVIAGRYRLQRRIGAGGMSEVWVADDLELERTVAVKLLATHADPTRFEREARAVAALSHANICALYDYGQDGGRRFMVLEHLAGGTLEDRLRPNRPLPDAETREIAAGIAGGLAHAHGRGVVHRDLKPTNILFDSEGRPKISDFGIARVDGTAGLTEVGTVLGTAAYIAPEQAAGEEATPASDVYAFGVILFRMLTGRLPFESADALTVAAMHRDLPAPAVSDFRADAPPQLESVAAASLAKSAADRPRDGAALAAELGAAGPGATGATEVIAPPPSKRRGALVAVAVVAIAAAGVGVAMAVTLGSGTTDTPATSSGLSTTAPRSTPLNPGAETAAAPPPATTTAPTTTALSTSVVVTTAPTTPTSPPASVPATTATPLPPPPPPPSTEATTTEPTPTDTVSTTTIADTTPTTAAAVTTPATEPG